MSVLDTFKAFLKDIKQLDSYGFSTDNSLIDPDGIRTDKLPVFPEWFWSAKLGQPRQINVYEVRQFAKSPWVQMVLNTIKKEVMIIDWDLVNVDEEDEDNHESDKKKVMDFFNKINSDGQNILDLCNPVITDLGEIDAGVWAKVFDVNSYEKKVLPVIDDMGKVVGEEEKFVLKPFGQRTIKEVRVGDASSFLKQIDIWGRLKAYFQYSFKNPRTNPNKFEPDEIIYFQMNKRSYSLYGFSPVQAIQQVLEVLIQSTRWNKEFFKSNAVPDGIIGMEGANPDSMRKFKEDWEKNIKGKAHKLAFMNTKVDFANLSPSSRDMEWLEGQKWYFHLVFGVFGVSPVEAGFHENVNQGNQAGQERVTVKNAIKPYLKALQNPINSFLIPEILQQENPKIKFKFNPVDHVEEKVSFDNSMKEIEVGTQTINEYRKYRGRAEVEWGDVPPNKSLGQPMVDDESGVAKPAVTTDEEDETQAKILSKELVEAGADVISESEDYDEFLLETLDKIESKVLKAVKKLGDEVQKDYFEKTFGEFLSGLSNSLNTLPFMKQLRKIIKKDYLKGVEGAESEVDIQIGFTESMDKAINLLEQQQLNGYTINGFSWPGIRGATKKAQVEILNQIQSDLAHKKSISEMSDNVRKIFATTKSGADRIARTETTRIINSGKLDGYKTAKIPRKAYASVMDDKTSDICKRLHNKYFDKGIPVDDLFIDDVTGKAQAGPPFHVNCRCVVEARLGKVSDAKN